MARARTLRAMNWGGADSPGVPTDVGSREHANAHLVELRAGRGDGDPSPRPGCLRSIVAVFVVIALIVVAIWLIGLLAGA